MDDEPIGAIRTYATPGPPVELGEPEVQVLPDADAVSAAAAARIVAGLTGAVRSRGRADWATTGGSTPLGIYKRLAADPLRGQVPWESVHLWWSDDRYVPRDHPLSNVFIADEALLDLSARGGLSGWGETGIDVDTGRDPGVWIPPENVHAFPCTQAIGEARGAGWCASRYGEELRVLPVENGWPAFDLVLLGVGPDGHIMSVFPDSPALTSKEWALPIAAPTHVEPHVSRVTLNPAVLDVARSIMVVSQGPGKAPILGTIFGEERDPRRWPAQLARRPSAVWLVDEAAAAQLPPSLAAGQQEG